MKEKLKCSFCNKSSKAIFDFYHHDGNITKIRACKNHFAKAYIEQNKISYLDKKCEIEQERLGRGYHLPSYY